MMVDKFSKITLNKSEHIGLPSKIHTNKCIVINEASISQKLIDFI